MLALFGHGGRADQPVLPTSVVRNVHVRKHALPSGCCLAWHHWIGIEGAKPADRDWRSLTCLRTLPHTLFLMSIASMTQRQTPTPSRPTPVAPHPSGTKHHDSGGRVLESVIARGTWEPMPAADITNAHVPRTAPDPNDVPRTTFATPQTPPLTPRHDKDAAMPDAPPPPPISDMPSPEPTPALVPERYVVPHKLWNEALIIVFGSRYGTDMDVGD